MTDIKIVKSNTLIRDYNFDLTLNEQKLLLMLIGNINNKIDTDFRVNTFKVANYMRLYNFVESGQNYALIKKQIQTLSNKCRWVTSADNADVSILLRWLNQVKINAKTKEISMTLHDDMMPYLLQQKDNFTSYNLSNIIPMKSRYSIRLYEILKSYAYQRQVALSIDQIKAMLCATKHKTVSNLVARVLTIALEEINRYTDLKVTYTAKKDGRKYTHLVFDIATAKDKPTIDTAPENLPPERTKDQARSKDTPKQKEPKKAIIAPPTKDELQEHVDTNHIVGVDLDTFVAYYKASDWKDSKGRAINWRQAIVVWAHNSKTRQEQSKAKTAPTPMYATSYDADEWELENLYKTPRL